MLICAGSAKRVTAVLPLFPYSRQPDLPYKKSGAPLSKQPVGDSKKEYTFESVPPTPGPGVAKSNGFSNSTDISRLMGRRSFSIGNGSQNEDNYFGKASASDTNGVSGNRASSGSISSTKGNYTTHDYENPSFITSFQARPGYKQWIAQAGTLIADLLTCAGADHIVCVQESPVFLMSTLPCEHIC